MALYQLEVITPLLAGLSKDLFSFRVYSKMDLADFRFLEYKIVLTQEDEEKYKDIFVKMSRDEAFREIYKLKKKELEKPLLEEGYVKIDYLFPRRHADVSKIRTYTDYLNWIDWWLYFIRPLRFAVKHIAQVDFVLIDVKPENVSLMLYANYNSRTKSPVIFESVTSGSKFIIEAQSTLDYEITARIGRGKNLGFGMCKIKPIIEKKK